MMDAFGALGDPTRRHIVELLARRGEMTAGDLASRFDSARPTVSRHLRVLRESGVVKSRASAQERRYRLDPQVLERMEVWLGRHRRFWLGRLDALERHLREDA